MSLVNYETGEIVEPMSVPDARRITERIRLTAGSARESLDRLQRLMEEAQAGQAHLALGYASWPAYIADVFSEEPLRLPRDQRQELVGYLAGEGMSTRAIAPIVGTSQRTVANDVSKIAHLPETPEPAPEGEAEAGPGQTPQGEVLPPSPRPAVTGLDGKTYIRPAPTMPRAAPRRALTDQFFDAAYDMTKAVERVQRLVDDDRWSQNAEKVAAKHRSDLLQAIDGLQSVINRLP